MPGVSYLYVLRLPVLVHQHRPHDAAGINPPVEASLSSRRGFPHQTLRVLSAEPSMAAAKPE